MNRLLRAVVLGLAAIAAGCDGCGGCGAEKAIDAAVVEAPVAAPEALLADVYVISPNASWSKLQRGVGGALGILPATLPHLVAMMAELDPRLAAELDGSSAMVGAAAGDPANPALCIAMKLVDPRRARLIALDGDAAASGVREEGSLTHLVPRAPPVADKKSAAAALTDDGYVVVGGTRDDLIRLAPYVTRTLSRREMPTEGAVVVDVPRASVEKVFAPKLEAAWSEAKSFLQAEDDRMRSERGGRAPDFGDPKAIIGAVDAFVGRRIAVFRDLDHVRIALDVSDAAVSVTATLTPIAGEGPAREWVRGMRVGDAAAVLDLPATSLVAASLRDTEAERATQAADIEKAVTSSLGERLKEDGANKLHSVLQDWTRGRDETLSVAYMRSDPSGAFVTTRARDAEAANASLRSAVDLTRVAPFQEALGVKSVTTSTEDLAGIGKVQVAKIARETKSAPSGKPIPKAIGVAWSTDAGSVRLAIGEEPVATLRAGAQPGKKLRDDVLVARFAESVGDTANVVVVGQPLRFDARRAEVSASPVVLALTRKNDVAMVRVDVSDALLRELTRMFMGF